MKTNTFPALSSILTRWIIGFYLTISVFLPINVYAKCQVCSRIDMYIFSLRNFGPTTEYEKIQEATNKGYDLATSLLEHEKNLDFEDERRIVFFLIKLSDLDNTENGLDNVLIIRPLVRLRLRDHLQIALKSLSNSGEISPLEKTQFAQDYLKN